MVFPAPRVEAVVVASSGSTRLNELTGLYQVGAGIQDPFLGVRIRHTA